MNLLGAQIYFQILLVGSLLFMQWPIAAQAATRLTLPAPIAWATYYGEGQTEILKQYQLVNLEGQNYSAAEISEIKSGGAKVISYLNVGACESDGEDARSYAQACQPYKLASYHGFPGEFWMDVSNPGWRSVVLDTIAPPLVAKGIDGFFFDNLDVVDLYENRPEITNGLLTLIRDLRAKYPAMIFIANNGLTVIDELLPTIDALAKEDVFSSYNFDTNTYLDQEVAATNETVATLTNLKQRALPILTIDFQTNSTKIEGYRQRTVALGFSPYISSIALNTISVPLMAQSATPSAVLPTTASNQDVSSMPVTTTAKNGLPTSLVATGGGVLVAGAILLCIFGVICLVTHKKRQ